MLRNSEFWGGLFWLLIGGFIVWAGHDMGLGRLNEPGPGFAFYWIGLLMSALALTVIAQALISGGVPLAALWEGTRWQKVAIVIVLLLAYALEFEAVGFIPATLALLLILMLFVDAVDWRVAFLVAIIATFGVWAVLTKWLKIQLPAGLLENILR